MALTWCLGIGVHSNIPSKKGLENWPTSDCMRGINLRNISRSTWFIFKYPSFATCEASPPYIKYIVYECYDVSRNKVTQYRYLISSWPWPQANELLPHIVGVCSSSQRSISGKIRILFLILSHSRLSLGNGRGWPVSSLVESGFSLQSSDRDSRLYKAIPTGQLSSQIDFTKHYSYEFMRELCQR